MPKMRLSLSLLRSRLTLPVLDLQVADDRERTNWLKLVLVLVCLGVFVSSNDSDKPAVIQVQTADSEVWRALKERAWMPRDRGGKEGKGGSIERNKVSSASRVHRRRRLAERRRNETRDSVKEKGVVESFLPCTAFHR